MLDITTETVLASVLAGSLEGDIPDSSGVYVTRTNTATLPVMETAGNTLVATVMLGDLAGGEEVTPVGVKGDTQWR